MGLGGPGQPPIKNPYANPNVPNEPAYLGAGQGTAGGTGAGGQNGSNPYGNAGPGTAGGPPLAAPPKATAPAPSAAPAPAPAAAPTGGYASGPGILEQWFGKRASGTDPGWEYAVGRGMNDIDSRMSAGGSYNSGARGQQLSDFAANMGTQREGQLDALAGGASGEYQNRLNSMFGTAGGMAGGQAGLAGAYDLGGANAMNIGNTAAIDYMLSKAGIDAKANQAGMQNGMMLGSLFA